MSRIRVIGGRWKRSPIDVPGVEGLRPTPDRVRETLFNWLGERVAGASCLDLFAGTGALGFEAASRGAADVVFVESDRFARAALRATIARLGAREPPVPGGGRDPRGGAPRMAVRATSAQAALGDSGRRGERFDLVLLDPPFGQGWIERVLPLLGPILAPQARVYVECEAELDDQRLAAMGLDTTFELLRSGRAGVVRYHLLANRAGEAR